MEIKFEIDEALVSELRTLAARSGCEADEFVRRLVLTNIAQVRLDAEVEAYRVNRSREIERELLGNGRT